MNLLRPMRPTALRLWAIGSALWLAAAPAVAQTLDLNRATQEELQQLPGVGESTAARIVEYRTENGPFGSVDELSKVRGIGAASLDRLRAHVHVGGMDLNARSLPAADPNEASEANVRRLLERYKNEPSVREVHEAAARYAEVHPELIQSWRIRSRLSALGPQVRGDYRYQVDGRMRVAQGGSSEPSRSEDESWRHQPNVRAQLDLDRLIFNPDELRVSNEIVDLVRLRESVLDQVTKIYYERRRLQLELDMTPPKDLAGRVRKELRLQELVADLDSLTGGFFSKRLRESGRDPY